MKRGRLDRQSRTAERDLSAVSFVCIAVKGDHVESAGLQTIESTWRDATKSLGLSQ